MFFSDREEFLVVGVGGHEYKVVRARLKKFLLLEQIRSERDVKGYLEACGVPTDGSFIELLEIYNALIRLNVPRVQIPLLTVHNKLEEEREEEPWSYLNRNIVSWVFLVTSRAHISLSDTLDMNIDDFFAFLQEALVDEQMEKEWFYSLSEVAYQYDSGSKQSRFIPMQRPSWMMNVRSKRQLKTIPYDMMPKGLVTSISPQASKLLDSLNPSLGT